VTTILPVSGYKIACPGNLPWQLIKHRHSTHLHVHFVTYCPDHLIKAKEWHEGQASGRRGAMCPIHHVEMSLSGICDQCD
jgi:hypothetical protein